uniref:Uncharacterized protein n=1 Tax=Salix viminalis TaxID=40686 RepID=A0A6N2LJS2_SALVM
MDLDLPLKIYINSDDQQQQQYDFSTDAFSAVFSIIVLLIGRSTSSRLEPVETGYCSSRRCPRQQPLPVACRFGKVQKKDESCSICLVEMEEEDAVSQLSRTSIDDDDD